MAQRIVATTSVLQASGAANSADEFNSGTLETGLADRLVGMIFADQPGTLYLEQSADNANWDTSTTYSISANDGKGFSEEIVAPYLRVRFKNTAGSAQTAFRLHARLTSSGPR